jgi:hypothetical protein
LTSPRRRLLPARGRTPDGLLWDGVVNEVGHREVARRLSEGQLGRPVGDDAEVRQGVAVQDAEKHLRDYAPADETESFATLGGLRLLEHVVPERRVLKRIERGLAHGPRHPLPRR